MSAEPELYVYWKVPMAQLPQALVAGRQLQALLRSQIDGLHARLLQRADGEGEGDATVLEIYALQGGLHARHREIIEKSAQFAYGAAGCLPAKRHVEIFQPG